MDFILHNWAELVLGLMAFVKVVINLTPTEKDNQIFGYLDSLINMIIADRINPTTRNNGSNSRNYERLATAGIVCKRRCNTSLGRPPNRFVCVLQH